MLRQMVLIALCLGTLADANLQCLYCNEAVSPIECDTVISCGKHERCYVDAYVSPTGSIRYNLGCRDENMCGTSPSIIKRDVSFTTRNGKTRSDSDGEKLMSSNVNLTLWSETRSLSSKRSNLLVCSECCTGNLCGSTGCGYKGYASPRGPICFNCAAQLTPGDCSKIQLCGRGEVCMLLKTLSPVTNEVRYKTECSTEKMCQNEIQKFNAIAALLMGRRRRREYHLEKGESCLVHCCTTDICNGNCGNNTNFYSNATSGIVSSQTTLPTLTASIQISARTTKQGFMHTHMSTNTQTTELSSTYKTPQPVTSSTTLNYSTTKIPQTTYRGNGTSPTIATQSIVSTSAFCMYKNKIYNQGDVWQDGCEFNCTCEYGKTGFYRCWDLCPVWNNLPAGCTLEKKPGECCPQPNCGGQILNPGATANTCFYGGKYHQEGDQWRDGCKYKCTCQDGKTGLYTCEALCLKWTLPSSCHLDPPPAGKCCEVLVCPSNVHIQYPAGYVQE